MAATIPRGSRLTPAWLDGRAHLIIVGLVAPLTLLYHRSRRATRSPLLLLALLLLLRCVLDPWDIAYYPLPFIIALLAWESTAGAPRVPKWTLAATLATWGVFVELPRHAGVDVQAIVFTAVALPAVALLAASLYGRFGLRRSVWTAAHRHASPPVAAVRR